MTLARDIRKSSPVTAASNGTVKVAPIGGMSARQTMELIGPTDVQLDQVTTAMLGDLADVARQVNEIRPMSNEVLRQVKDELMGERVFNSNAIEGNTLTLRETRLILQTKTIHDIRRRREAQEAPNLAQAAEQIEHFLGEEGTGTTFPSS